jgi:hypothetical protein
MLAAARLVIINLEAVGTNKAPKIGTCSQQIEYEAMLELQLGLHN